MLGVGCWVLGVGCWVLGVGCWVLGVGCWVLGVYLLNDVQQAIEVVCVAALCQVHQQLGGLFSNGKVPVFSYPTELGDHHHLNQLVLEQGNKVRE